MRCAIGGEPVTIGWLAAIGIAPDAAESVETLHKSGIDRPVITSPPNDMIAAAVGNPPRQAIATAVLPATT